MSSKCQKVVTQGYVISHARKVYSKDKVTRRAQRRIETLRACLRNDEAKKNVRRVVRKLRKRYKERRALRPFDCGRAGRFAVPCGVVFRESRFSCTAQNPSSTAYGYYQLLDTWWGHLGRKPTCAEQHRIAARLWNGGAGASHWSLTL